MPRRTATSRRPSVCLTLARLRPPACEPFEHPAVATGRVLVARPVPVARVVADAGDPGAVGDGPALGGHAVRPDDDLATGGEQHVVGDRVESELIEHVPMVAERTTGTVT